MAPGSLSVLLQQWCSTGIRGPLWARKPVSRGLLGLAQCEEEQPCSPLPPGLGQVLRKREGWTQPHSLHLWAVLWVGGWGSELLTLFKWVGPGVPHCWALLTAPGVLWVRLGSLGLGVTWVGLGTPQTERGWESLSYRIEMLGWWTFLVNVKNKLRRIILSKPKSSEHHPKTSFNAKMPWCQKIAEKFVNKQLF